MRRSTFDLAVELQVELPDDLSARVSTCPAVHLELRLESELGVRLTGTQIVAQQLNNDVAGFIVLGSDASLGVDAMGMPVRMEVRFDSREGVSAGGFGNRNSIAKLLPDGDTIEEGEDAIVAVALTSLPQAAVRISLDVMDGRTVPVDAASSLSAPVLVFDPSNWNMP